MSSLFSAGAGRRSRVVGALVLALALGGCPGPTFVVQQYAGPVRAPDAVATLRVNGGDTVRLLTLDGDDVRAPLESDSRLHIELLPGRHRLAAGNSASAGVSGGEGADEVAFVAEAGKVYRVVFVDTAAHVVEVNRGSDASGADVTAAPSRAGAPSAPSE